MLHGEVMLLLIAGLILFFAIHSISIINDDWRDGMVRRLGAGPWRILHGLASLVGLVLLIWGYGIARHTPVILYAPPDWLRHVNFFLMLFVFPLLLVMFLPGRIKTAVKYPAFTAVKVWAFAHLLVNGALADVLLFGCFLIWAVAGRISMKQRRQRPVPGLPAAAANDLIGIAAGLGIYMLFLLYLHRPLIGVALLPGW